MFGALPGLTATMGVALFVPLTFGLPPVVAFGLLLGVYVGGIYGGSITAILVKTPGTPASAATVVEGYAMTQKGRAGQALSMATIASFIGGIFSCLVLIIVAPQSAKVALAFGPPEYFSLAIFGLSIVVSVSTGSILKGAISALFGLLISTIGMDPITGTARFTFGVSELLNGIDVVPALVGLFGISEVMAKLEQASSINYDIKTVSFKGITLGDLKHNALNLLRSSVIGTIIGIIPATGSGMASWLAYNEAKRASKHPEEYGKGIIDGVAATESANNAVTGGALVPLLTLGIPGDVVTAIMLGALMIQGLTPGPLLFKNSGDVVIGIFTALIISNIFMLILGLGAIRVFTRILKMPEGVLFPLIVVLCVLGSYSISNSFMDVIVMLVFGILGYIMIKFGFPLPALLLALILSPLLESNFRRAMIISHNNLSVFLTRPVSLVVLLLTAVMLIKSGYDERKRSASI